MSSGSSARSESQSRPNFGPEQQRFYGSGVPAFFQAQQNISPYTGPRIAGQQGTETQGIGLLGGQVAGQQGLAGAQAGNALGFLLSPGGALNVNSNPFLQQAILAAQQPTVQSFQESVAPGINTSAVAAGQSGSSRHGVAEGLAQTGLAQALSNSAASTTSAAYGQGLQALLSGLTQTPQVQSAFAAPAYSQIQAGGLQRGFEQSQIDADRALFQELQFLPYLLAKEQIAAGHSFPTGTSSTGSSHQGGSVLGSLLGLAGAAGNFFGGGNK